MYIYVCIDVIKNACTYVDLYSNCAVGPAGARQQRAASALRLREGGGSEAPHLSEGMRYSLPGQDLYRDVDVTGRVSTTRSCD